MPPFSLENMRSHVGKCPASGQRHRRLELVAQQPKNVRGAHRAVDRQAIDDGPADKYRAGAERDGFEYVGAATNSPVEQQRYSSVRYLDDFRQYVDGRR